MQSICNNQKCMQINFYTIRKKEMLRRKVGFRIFDVKKKNKKVINCKIHRQRICVLNKKVIRKKLHEKIVN